MKNDIMCLSRPAVHFPYNIQTYTYKQKKNIEKKEAAYKKKRVYICNAALKYAKKLRTS